MQKEIQLTDKTLLVVGLPKDATNLVVDGNGRSTVRLSFYKNGWGWDCISIPKSDWKLVGIYPELTEEQAKMVVDLPQYEHYFNYNYQYPAHKWLQTAKESSQSLMERENITGYDKYAILIKSK